MDTLKLILKVLWALFIMFMAIFAIPILPLSFCLFMYGAFLFHEL